MSVKRSRFADVWSKMKQYELFFLHFSVFTQVVGRGSETQLQNVGEKLINLIHPFRVSVQLSLVLHAS